MMILDQSFQAMQKLQLTDQQGMKYEMNGGQITGWCNGWFVQLAQAIICRKQPTKLANLLLCF